MIPLNRALLGGVVLLTLNSVQAQTSANIYLQGGAQPGALACVACHGADGMGLAPAGFPRLAGISADYLSKQLHDFQSGKRVSPVMQPLAKALTDDEIASVTQAIAAMPAPPVPPINRSSMPEGVGETLALRGAWERQIPECVSCHGPGGAGVGSAFPPLANQPAMYLVAQLNAWRDGSRKNDPNDLMGHIAKAMSEDEVKAVAEYFSTVGHKEVAP